MVQHKSNRIIQPSRTPAYATIFGDYKFMQLLGENERFVLKILDKFFTNAARFWNIRSGENLTIVLDDDGYNFAFEKAFKVKRMTNDIETINMKIKCQEVEDKDNEDSFELIHLSRSGETLRKIKFSTASRYIIK